MPVNHTDPFGLSPTDIIVEGENSKKTVEYLRANSATFRDAYDALDNDHSEARARDGARVYFRNAGNGVVEILAMSTKGTQDQVIKVLKQLY